MFSHRVRLFQCALVAAGLSAAAFLCVRGIPPASADLSFEVRLFLACWIVSYALLAYVYLQRRAYEEKTKILRGVQRVDAATFDRRVRGNGIGVNHVTPHGVLLATIRREDEPKHLLVSADTGAGKSTLFHGFMYQLRSRRYEKCLVYDPHLDYWRHHGISACNDKLFYPDHKDCPYWDIFGEIASLKNAAFLARSFIPPTYDERSKFWTEAAQDLLAYLLWHLKQEPNPTVKDLIDLISDTETMTVLVKGTPMQPYLDPSAGGLRNSVLATMNAIAKSLVMIPDHRRAVWFSFKAWAPGDEGWSFLGTRNPEDQAVLLPLFSAMLNVGLNSLKRKKGGAKNWFFVDELASLQCLPVLKDTLAQGRNFNLCTAIAVQDLSQLRAKYGLEGETMISSCKTKIFLRASNARNAEWVADMIGKPEQEKHEESYSSHLWDASRDSIAQSKQRTPEHLVLPNELQQLDDLHGYLLYKNYLVPIHIALQDLIELNEID